MSKNEKQAGLPAKNKSRSAHFSNLYCRTDMASEIAQEAMREYSAEHAGAPDGVECETLHTFGFRVERVRLNTKAAAKKFGKDIGCYTTLFLGEVQNMERHIQAVAALAWQLQDCAWHLVGSVQRVLVVGLGNRELTCDALGPLCVSQLPVFDPAPSEISDVPVSSSHEDATSTMSASDDPSSDMSHSASFSDQKHAQETMVGGSSRCRLFTFAPGVRAQTGMETLSLVRAARQVCRAQLVVLVDTLAARSADWLCKTVQLADVGVRPGSGIGARTSAIVQRQLGVPVMTVGVPMLIDASTMMFDVLQQDPYTPETQAALERVRGMLVSISDADVAVNAWAKVIASALEMAFVEG